MRSFFQTLFEYNHHCNQAFIDIISLQKEKVSERCVQVFSHILNAHQIWNCRLQGIPPIYATWDVQPIENFSSLDDKNYEDSCHILETSDLDGEIKWSTAKGSQFVNKASDILFHAINHSTYHRGQIAIELRQAGIEPILSDFIVYKMKNGSL